MDTTDLAKAKRRQDRLEKLGTQHPACALCGERDERCLERHHIAGRKFGAETVILCRNCHRKASDGQKDHPPGTGQVPPSVWEQIGHFLLGLADLLLLAAEKLKEFGRYLIAHACEGIADGATVESLHS